MDNTHEHGRHATSRSGFRIPSWLGALIFAGIAAFFLFEEHRAHMLGALPYVLLLACPLLHFGMHGGHGNHGGESHHPEHGSEPREGGERSNHRRT